MTDIYDILPTLGPMNRILDIGCSRMVDTAKLRAMFPDAEIHAFDPDPRTVKAIHDESIDKMIGVEFHPVALHAYDGDVGFYLSTALTENGELHTESSSLKTPTSFNGTEARPHLRFDPQWVKVRAAHLDLFRLWPVDFIWMDAQASEDGVIYGGPMTLHHTRYLYTEHNTDGDYCDEPGLKGIMALLPGWTVEHLWKDDVLLKNPNQ